jgi:hypothetical protein
MTKIVDRPVELLELERANGDAYKTDIEVFFLQLAEEGWSEAESSDALEKSAVFLVSGSVRRPGRDGARSGLNFVLDL